MTRLPSLPGLPQLPRLFPQQQLPPPDPRLTPEEENSLLGNVMSAVQYVGETLDKPGAAVRGLIAGQPEQLLNLIPFSDTMEWTDPQKRVSGRDLLEQGGFLSANTPGLDWGDVAGFGAEVLTDPLLFATGPMGSLTKQGLGKVALKGSRAADWAGAKALTEEAISKVAAGEGVDAVRLMSTPTDIATQFREGDRALWGWRLPQSMGGASFTLGSAQGTPIGRFAANKTADFIEAIAYGKGGKLAQIAGLPSAALRGLFSSTAGATGRSMAEFTGAVQLTKDLAFSQKEALKDFLKDVAPAYRKQSEYLRNKFMDIAEVTGKYGDQRSKDLAYKQFQRDVLELDEPDNVASVMQRYLDTDPANPSAMFADPTQAVAADIGSIKGLADQYHDFFDTLVRSEDAFYQRYQALGGKGEELSDMYARHFGRRGNIRIDMQPGVVYSRADAAARQNFEFARARNDLIRNYPGRTAGVNKIATDETIWGYRVEANDLVRMKPAEHKAALQKYLDDAGIPHDPNAGLDELQTIAVEELHFRPDLMAEVKPGGLAPPGAEADLIDQFKRGRIDEDTFNAERAKTFDFEWRRLTGTPIKGTTDATGEFTEKAGQSISDQMRSYFTRTYKDPKTGKSIPFPKEVIRDGLFNKDAVDDWFSYMDSIAESKATMESAHRFLAQPGLVRVATGAPDDTGVPLAQAWKDAGFDQRGIDTFIAENPQFTGKTADELLVDQRAVPALRAYSEIRRPKVQNIIGEFIDRYLMAPWKGMLTVPFPAFHTRNLLSSSWQHATDGHINIAEDFIGKKAAATYARTGKGLDYVQEAIDNGVLSNNTLVELFGEASEKTASHIPQGFLGLRGMGEALMETKAKQGWKGVLNPFNMRGVKTPDPITGEITQGVLGELGDRLYGYVEFLNRAGYYEILRKKGHSPAQAAYLVKRADFDYGAISSFEKSVMRRVAPFYSFTKFNLPYQLLKLAERPGGMAAQTYRAYENLANPREQYIPSFLKEGLAASIGGTPDATTFLRQGGLPLEELNKFVFEGGIPSRGRTLSKLASYLHPLLNAPIEAASGTQLFTGRRLADLEPLAPGLLGEDWGRFAGTFAHYTPFSRAVNEAQSLFDPRKEWWQKAMNVATGAKAATYDTEKLRLWDLQKLYRDKVERDPFVRVSEQPYVPSRLKADAPPETKRDLKRIKALAKAIERLQAKRDAAKAT